jgi:menaquinone-dependent protoporphyrinogen oxidase
MTHILIAYATRQRHTEGIAEQMREAIAARGVDVQLERLGKAPLDVPLDTDGVIVGGAIHAGKHLPELVAFARKNRDRLATLPTSFFTVCLTAVDDTPAAAAETEKYVKEFIDEAGWKPDRTTAFAGKLAWTQYDFFTRLIMKLITRQHGLKDQDTSRDYDYTDYEAVRRYATDFSTTVDEATRTTAAPAGRVQS